MEKVLWSLGTSLCLLLGFAFNAIAADDDHSTQTKEALKSTHTTGKVRPTGVPKDTQVISNVFSRGNDDVGETDKKGVSGYETARIALNLKAVTDDKGTISFGLDYHGLLVTKENQAPPIAKNFGLVEKTNPISGDPTQKKRFAVEINRDKAGKITDGSTIKAAIVLGKLDKDKLKTDKTYEGVTDVRFKEGEFVKQVVKWKVEVKDGKIASMDVKLSEKGPSARPEMTKLVGSSDEKQKLDKPFPTKSGEATGPAKVGD